MTLINRTYNGMKGFGFITAEGGPAGCIRPQVSIISLQAYESWYLPKRKAIGFDPPVTQD